MLNSKPINELLFFDVETVPQEKSFFDLSERKQELFMKRFKKDAEEMIKLPMDRWGEMSFLNCGVSHDDFELFYNNRAALHAEFAKVVCISFGWIEAKAEDLAKALASNEPLNFRTRSIAGTDEVVILKDFQNKCGSILSKTVNPSHHIVAYNAFMFDVPMLAKRYMINFLKIPEMFDTDGKKEWNLPYIVDPKLSWKMTSFDGAASLDLLCETLGVESSKTLMNGSEVRDTYYVDKDMKKISTYCTADVVALAECYLRMKGLKNKLNVL